MSDATAVRCPRSREQATLFVARELGLFARARFAAHLRDCGECAAAVSEMEEAGAALGVMAQPRLSAAARERLSAAARRLGSGASRPSSRSLPPWRLAALTATLAAALVVALVYRPVPPRPTASWPGPPRPKTEVPLDPTLLAWDPAPGDLARVADEIRGLRRSARASPTSLSGRDRTLGDVRKRIHRLRGTGIASPG